MRSIVVPLELTVRLVEGASVAEILMALHRHFERVSLFVIANQHRRHR
jgi:hypothetical protein